MRQFIIILIKASLESFVAFDLTASGIDSLFPLDVNLTPLY